MATTSDRFSFDSALGWAPFGFQGNRASVQNMTRPDRFASHDAGSEPAVGGLQSGNTRPDLGPPSPPPHAVEQPGSGLGLIISAVVAALVFFLAIYATGDADESRLPIAQTTNALFWIVAGIAVIAAAVGALYAERTASRGTTVLGELPGGPWLATAWIVPAVATFAAVFLVATYHNATMIVVGPVVAFLGNAGALLARDLLDDASEASLRTATTIHTLIIHAVAVLALGVVYLNKFSTPIGAPLVGIIGGLLTLETLERGTANRQTRVLYSLLAGWVMAQAMIAINWWQTLGWTGGAVLLVCFYVAAGVMLARTQRSIMRGRDVIEFGVVSLIAFAVLALTA